MIFKLQIDCDNAAFGASGIGAELARILQQVAVKVGDAPEVVGGTLRDSNGNSCGFWRFTK